MPAQLNVDGLSVIVGVPGVMVLPQLSVTVGGVVGATASAGQATVDAPSAGSVNVGALMVYVYTHVCVVLSHSV